MAIQTAPSALSSSPREPILTPSEMAAYSLDMLLALRSMADQSGHRHLAELLEVAAAEAERIVKVTQKRAPLRK